jgi:hypothetical protein
MENLTSAEHGCLGGQLEQHESDNEVDVQLSTEFWASKLSRSRSFRAA